MVDFDSEATMGKPPKEIVAFIIIEKVYNFLEADESYSKTLLNGTQSFISVPRARLRTLYLTSHKLLERNLKKEELAEVHSVCMDLEKDAKQDDLLDAFSTIFMVLDKVGLWKIDTKKMFDRSRVEVANSEHGY